MTFAVLGSIGSSLAQHRSSRRRMALSKAEPRESLDVGETEDALTDRIYGPRNNIHERFPGLTGLRLLNKVNSWYRVPPKNRHVKLFSEDGARLFEMQSDNIRDQKVVEDDYVRSVLTKGNVSGVRGQPWAVLSEGEQPPFNLISYGTLARAIYRAAQAEPDNPNVLATLEQGLENLQVYSSKTPIDVIRWLRDFHNEFHGGSGFTVLELLKLVEKIEAQWKAHATLKGLSVSNVKAREEWINSAYPGKVASNHNYCEAKATIHAMRRLGVYDEVTKMIGQLCDFNDRGLKNDELVSALHELTVIMEGKFRVSMAKPMQRIIIAESIKFMIPTAGQAGQEASDALVSPFFCRRSVDWLLNSREVAKERLKWLLTGMGESVAVKKLAQQFIQRPSGPSTRPSKRAKRAPAKQEDKEKPGPEEVEVFEPLGDEGGVSEGTMTTREKCWLDDLVACLDFALAKGPSSISALGETQCRQMLSSFALEFCFRGSIVINSTTYVSWSTLRPKLQELAASAMSAGLARLSAESGVPLVTEVNDIQAALMACLSDKPAVVAVAPSSLNVSTQRARSLAEDGEQCLVVRKLVDANALGVPLRMRSLYTTFRTQAWCKACALRETSEGRNDFKAGLVDMYSELISDVFGDEWCVVMDGIAAALEDDDYPEWASTFFEAKDAKDYLHLRLQYFLESLSELVENTSSNEVLLCRGDLVDLKAACSSGFVLDALREIDVSLMAKTRSDWASVWRIVLKANLSSATTPVQTNALKTLVDKSFFLTRRLAVLPEEGSMAMPSNVEARPANEDEAAAAADPCQGPWRNLLQTLLFRDAESVAKTSQRPSTWEKLVDDPIEKCVACLAKFPIQIHSGTEAENNFSVGYLHRLAKFVEWSLFDVAHRQMPSHVSAESLYINIMEKKTPITTSNLKGVRLPFLGTITTSRVAPCTQIGQILVSGDSFEFVLPLYVSGQGLGDILGQRVVLAWAVKTVKDPATATTIVATQDVELELPLSLKLGWPDEPTHVTVKLKTLVGRDDIDPGKWALEDSSGQHGVELTRVPFDDEMLRPAAKSHGRALEKLTDELLGFMGVVGAARQFSSGEGASSSVGAATNQPKARASKKDVAKHLTR